jgi:hypothetical protein
MLRLGAYALVLGLTLQAAVSVSAIVPIATLVREDGPIETAQTLLIALSGVLLLYGASRSRPWDAVLTLLALACVYATVRELDGFFARNLAKGSYRFFEIPVVLAVVAVGWRGRGRLFSECARFLATPAAPLVFAGALIVLVQAQVLGEKALARALVSDASARVVKQAFEELCELAGYLVVLFGAVEVVIECRSDRGRM